MCTTNSGKIATFSILPGSLAQDALLIVSSKSKHPTLICKAKDSKKILWDGPSESLRPLAHALSAQLIEASDPCATALDELKGHDIVFAPNAAESLASLAAWPLRDKAASNRQRDAYGVLHSDCVLERLRLIKDPLEIEAIEQAATKTNLALFESLSLIRSGTREDDYALTLEHLFRMHGGAVAFPTIAASGKHAAVLHHMPKATRLRAGELFLIDCGAECSLYAADITRVLPVSGSFSSSQRALYETVLHAHDAAIEAIRPGVLFKKVYEAAALVLTKGLISLKVLRGDPRKLMKRKAYAPYFPHSIGHSLGLDVHDIGGLRANNETYLEEGMVVTIEPGLYFPKPAGRVPACGVRIEDDVLVTKRGHRVLSAGFPTETSEVEALLG